MFSIISTIASIIGAGIAIWEARNAKKYADFIKKVKNRLENRRVSSELSKLHYSLKEVKNNISKYGPSATEMSLKGVNTHKDAQNLQDFLSLLKEHRNVFEAKNYDEIDEFCENLNLLIEKLVDANEFAEMKMAGRKILRNLNDFSAKLKDLKDKKEKELIDS